MQTGRLFLFDLDGTLINSEDISARAHAAATSIFGKPVDKMLYKSVLGESRAVVSQAFMTAGTCDCSQEDYERTYVEAKRRIMQEEGVKLQSGARELLSRVRSRASEIALVTSSDRDHMDRAVNNTAITHFFDTMVCGDDLPPAEHKPKPEPYLLAISRLPTSPFKPVVFEDTPAGIASAKAAGCYVFAVRHLYNEDFSLSEADMILENGFEGKYPYPLQQLLRSR